MQFRFNYRPKRLFLFTLNLIDRAVRDLREMRVIGEDLVRVQFGRLKKLYRILVQSEKESVNFQ